MLKVFKLIRGRTLAFTAFIMYAMRYFVIKPILDINGFTLQLSDGAFTCLVIAVCCLVSAAYIINDYFDTKTDQISGVRDVVVGRHISRRAAISLHTVLNLISVSIAFYLGFKVGIWKIGLLFLLASVLLWLYSSSYKRYFIIGNMIVGLGIALIPVSAVIYEIPLLNTYYADILIKTDTNFIYIFKWIFGFSAFLFLNILMYEINKDIYTVVGDKEDFALTIPVKYGAKAARYTIAILSMICVFLLIFLYYAVFIESTPVLIYFVLALILPYIIYIVSICWNKGGRKFQLIWIRLITLLCVAFSLLLNHFFQLVFERS